MMDRRVFILASDFPYPPNHGGRADVYEKIKAIYRLGYSIVLLATIKEDPKEEELSHLQEFCENIILIHRSRSMGALFSFYPYQVSSRSNKKELTKALGLLEGDSFEFCIIEGAYCFALAQAIAKKIDLKNIFLRIHNNEKNYFLNLAKASSSIFKKLFYLLEAFKFYFFEKKMMDKGFVDKFCHISKDEYLDYKKDYKELKSSFFPASIDLASMQAYSEKRSKKVLFVGSLFMENNLSGLLWYLHHVHPLLLKECDAYSLVVAGNTKGCDKESFVSLFSKFSGVCFYDSPQSLEPYYKEASVFINPMLHGAGVKLKTIHAIKEGLAVVATSVGAEGIGLEDQKDIIVAKSALEFKEGIIALLSSSSKRESLVRSAQEYLKTEYDVEKNVAQLFQSKTL